MSRFSSMPASKKRAYAIGTILFFVVMTGLIGWGYVVAESRIR